MDIAVLNLRICKKCNELKPHYLSNPYCCKDCQKLYPSMSKENRKEQSHKRRIKNPEKYEEQKAYYRQWYRDNWGRAKENRQKNKAACVASARKGQLKKYGLTPASFEKMFATQGAVCAACGSADPLDKRGWIVDHHHNRTYQAVRAILCGPCNRTIGHAKESVKRLRACALYLEIDNDYLGYNDD